MPRCLFGGAICGKPRIRIGGHIFWRQCVRQFNNVASRRFKRFRITAITINARERSIAMHIMPTPASQTSATSNFGVHDDRVAFFKTFNFGTYVFDPSSVFMAHNQGQQSIPVWISGHPPDTFDNMQVGATNTGAADTHNNITRFFYFGICNIFHVDPR